MELANIACINTAVACHVRDIIMFRTAYPTFRCMAVHCVCYMYMKHESLETTAGHVNTRLHPSPHYASTIHVQIGRVYLYLPGMHVCLATKLLMCYCMSLPQDIYNYIYIIYKYSE